MPFLQSLSRIVPWPLLRAIAIGVVCAGGIVVLSGFVGDAYPMRDWLIWTILAIFGWCAVFNLACVCFGYLVLTRVLSLREMPMAEKLVTSMGIGLVGFVSALYVAGALRLFVPWLALALPVVMIASGAPAFREVFSVLGQRAISPRTWSSRWTTAMVVGLGVVCLALVYLQCMAPGAINYDSR
jgi:hypothetical protein